MCLALPMKIKSIKDNFAEALAGGILRKVNIQMLPNLKPGDYCLVHAGFAIEKLDPKRAQETLRLIDEIR